MSLKRVRGTEDHNSNVKQQHNFITQIAKETAQSFCFYEVATPILEFTEVFARTLGEDSDVVHKEMYTFKDRNNENISLRPEGTAGIARYFITEKLHRNLPLRLFYQGPMFRYERPQKGRLRQFHTVGVELLGEDSAKGDIECLSLAYLFFKNLGIQKDIQLEINSVGDKESHAAYQKSLLDYLTPLKQKLSEDSRKRLLKNPLRILDSKEEEDKEIIKSAPLLTDFLNKPSQLFFEEIQNNLDNLEIPWTHNPLLVRGLDYYNHCVFEFKSNSGKLGTQNTVLAGGRYDRLIEIMAGDEKRVHGVGWGAGIERLCLLVDKSIEYPQPIVLVPLGEKAEQQAITMAWQLRKEGFCVFHPRTGGNLSKKMKRAAQVQARYTVIFGPEEIQNKVVSIKDMSAGTQQSVPTNQLLSFMKKNSV